MEKTFRSVLSLNIWTREFFTFNVNLDYSILNDDRKIEPRVSINYNAEFKHPNKHPFLASQIKR